MNPHPRFRSRFGRGPCLLLAAVVALARAQTPPTQPPGPWDQDILVYRVPANGTPEQLTSFPRGGVATAARLGDGRLAVAYQCFPENNPADFDKVAIHFSADEGRTWTAPNVIRVRGLPAGMRFPFDPTLVPLPDGRVRIYFTSRLLGPGDAVPAIYSAISENAIDYTFEPGMRFGLERRGVIDCAVVLHRGTFHLFAPDNGVGLEARAEHVAPARGPGGKAPGRRRSRETRRLGPLAERCGDDVSPARQHDERLRERGGSGHGVGLQRFRDPALRPLPGKDL